MTDAALGSLAQTGLTGLMLVLSLLALRSKDRELSAEKAERINDARENLKLIMGLQAQVILAVNKLSDLVDILEKRAAADAAARDARAVAHAARDVGPQNPYRKSDK